MSNPFKQSTAFQPVVSFVGFITLGVILAVYVNTNPNYRLPIILLGFIMGFIFAGFELKAIINETRNSNDDENEKSRDEKVARYVAELFDEDIPFNDIYPGKENDTNDNEEL